MDIIRIKGHEFKLPPIRDSYDRRATLFKNEIIATLKKIGVPEDDIDIKLPRNARLGAPAKAGWIFDGHYLQYDYKRQPKYIENLYLVWKVIQKEVELFASEQKTVNDFLHEFTKQDDLEKVRKEARQTLNVAENETNIELITKRYKTLAKEHHPDSDGGDQEKFKKISNAFQVLKRELS